MKHTWIITMMILITLPSTQAQDCWTGTWETNWGPMELKQSGNTVTGSYTHDSGTIDGIINGKVLEGKWNEKPPEGRPKGPHDSGRFEFTINEGCNHFDSKWNYDDDKAMRTDWSGDKKEAAKGSCEAECKQKGPNSVWDGASDQPKCICKCEDRSNENLDLVKGTYPPNCEYECIRYLDDNPDFKLIEGSTPGNCKYECTDRSSENLALVKGCTLPNCKYECSYSMYEDPNSILIEGSIPPDCNYRCRDPSFDEKLVEGSAPPNCKFINIFKIDEKTANELKRANEHNVRSLCNGLGYKDRDEAARKLLSKLKESDDRNSRAMAVLIIGQLYRGDELNKIPADVYKSIREMTDRDKDLYNLWEKLRPLDSILRREFRKS